jgi:tetratricopeptide (TPR) repeat protein
MRLDRGLVFAFGATAFAAACASAGTAGAGETQASAAASALPQVECNGAAPAVTPQATAAQNALNRTLIVQGDARTPLYQTALTESQAGIAADPNNPLHYYLAAQAHVGTGDLTQANTMLTRAQELCPGFAGEVATLRRQAWGTSLAAGVAALEAGDTATAITSWTRANEIYQGEASAPFNLALVYNARQDAARAGQYARETLRILSQIPADTSAAVMSEREDMRAGAAQLIFNTGVAAFQAENFPEAANIFRSITEVDRNYREAWTNYAFALYRQERWNEVIPVAMRLLELDPLNENAMLVLAEAYRQLERGSEGVQIRERVRDAPVYVEGLSIRYDDDVAIASGQVVGNAARAGTPVRLEVTFTGPTGDLGTQTVTVAAPAKGERAPFEARLDGQGRATSFRYRAL